MFRGMQTLLERDANLGVWEHMGKCIIYCNSKDLHKFLLFSGAVIAL